MSLPEARLRLTDFWSVHRTCFEVECDLLELEIEAAFCLPAQSSACDVRLADCLGRHADVQTLARFIF